MIDGKSIDDHHQGSSDGSETLTLIFLLLFPRGLASHPISTLSLYFYIDPPPRAGNLSIRRTGHLRDRFLLSLYIYGLAPYHFLFIFYYFPRKKEPLFSIYSSFYVPLHQRLRGFSYTYII